MSKFKERLWRDLMREHRSELAQIDRPAAGRARYARPRLLAGTTVGFAVIATAIVLFLSAASTPAAFAVSGNSDGTVSVVLRRIRRDQGRERAASGAGNPGEVCPGGFRLPRGGAAGGAGPDQDPGPSAQPRRSSDADRPAQDSARPDAHDRELDQSPEGARRQVGPRREGSPGLHRRPRATGVAVCLGSGPRMPHRGGQGARRGHRASTARCLDRHASAWRPSHHRHGSGPRQGRRTHRQQRAVHGEQRRTHRQQRAVHREQRRTDAGRSRGTAAHPPATAADP